MSPLSFFRGKSCRWQAAHALLIDFPEIIVVIRIVFQLAQMLEVAAGMVFDFLLRLTHREHERFGDRATELPGPELFLSLRSSSDPGNRSPVEFQRAVR